MTHTFSEVSEQIKFAYGFDPQYHYCAATGKPIGFAFIDELTEVIDSIPGDIESVADDLAMRIIASMRPSVKWNRIQPDDLNLWGQKHPIETMAYLLNRFFEPAKGQPLHWFKTSLDRIKLFQWLLAQPITGAKIDSIRLMLLELESKQSLVIARSPIDCQVMLGDSDPILVLYKAIQQYYLARTTELAESESNGFAIHVNLAARRAFFSNLLDAGLTEAATEAKAAKAAKQQDKNVLSTILESIMTPDKYAAKPSSQRVSESSFEQSQVSLANTQMPKRFGAKAVQS